MYLQEIATVLGTSVLGNPLNNHNLLHFNIDSRKIANPEQSVFVAISSNRRDGNEFIKDAYSKGVRVFLCGKNKADLSLSNASFIEVDNTLKALQILAIAARSKYTYPIIGITGSNGKTIVKEGLYQLLSSIAPFNNQLGPVRSPKSYNSQIGVPISVLQMQQENTIGIFEAGISQPGEMEHLQKIIEPQIGIFTNIGEAHSEGFLNQRQKINEKLVLFKNAKTLIYCRDYGELNEQILQFSHQIKPSDSNTTIELFTWSKKGQATLQIMAINKSDNQSQINGIYQDREVSIQIPYITDAYIENAIHCWCLLLKLNISDAVIAAHMTELQPVAMRLELLHGVNDCTLINDTYNSDFTSFKIAIDFLEQQVQHSKKTIILSDMLQGGKPDAVMFEDVAELIKQKHIQRLIGIGSAISKYKDIFKANAQLETAFYQNTSEFLQEIHLINFSNEAILLKGARNFKFEKIEKILEEKLHKTILEVNLGAMEHNLNVYRNMLEPGVKTMAMVKAYSYGSGSFEVANMLQYAGVDYLTVAYSDEGIALRQGGINLPIMVTSPELGIFDRMIAWKLEPEIFNLHSLNEFSKIAKALDVSNYPIHIKLDTGMHRLGFMEHEIDDLLSALAENTYVKVVSIFSHFVGSDSPEFDDFSQTQAERYIRMSDKILEALPYKPLRHLCNSSGISRFPQWHFDMVRLGIGLYGFDAYSEVQQQLQNVSTLKSTIVQIKEVNAGETVGYSRRGQVMRPSRIATIGIGYADGYFRAMAGKAFMLVNGQKAPLIGNVCMDMSMIDITDILNVKEGDEVIVFGNNLPVTLLAEWANTIPYEVLTDVGQRVKRVYVND